jgi:hypothetical protein
MSSPTKLLVRQIKGDLLKEHQNHINNHSPGSQDRDERILDLLERLDELEIDMNILKETYIGRTVADFKKKGYSKVITIKARALVEKWKRICSSEEEDAKKKNEISSPLQVNDEVKVAVQNSNSNNIEGNYKSDDNSNIRDTGNGDGINSDEPHHSQTDNTNTNKTTTKMVCDICSKPAHYRDFIGQLQKCKDCGMYVHELCYCLVPTTSLNPNFTCHACKAVGTTVEVNVPSKIGGTGVDMGKEREQMRVEERPMECILCLHNSGYHAMHPLYDTCGKEGRQYVLKAKRAGIGGKPRRLAWVHTLCAQMLTIQKGWLYGVDKDGDWQDCTKKDEDSEDNENGNDSSSDDSDEEVGGQKYKLGTRIYKEFLDEETCELRVFEGKVKRFNTKEKFYEVIYEDGDEEEMTATQIKKYLQKPTIAPPKKPPQEPVSVATRNFCINADMSDEINEARKLKCVICGVNDEMSLRIPTQCNAGYKGLHAELQQYLGDVPDPCIRAMHVGCEFCSSNSALFRLYIIVSCANSLFAECNQVRDGRQRNTHQLRETSVLE